MNNNTISNNITLKMGPLELKMLLRIIYKSDFLLKHLGNIREFYSPKLSIPETICNKLKTVQTENFSDFRDLCELACKMFLLTTEPMETSSSFDLLHKVFTIDEINEFAYDPEFLHWICSELFKVLKTNKNMMILAKTICSVSSIGYTVSLSLAWAVFIRITKQTHEDNYNHYMFSTIVSFVENLNLDIIITCSNGLPIIFQIITFLLHVLSRENDDDDLLKKYVSHFGCKKKDILLLKALCKQLVSFVERLILSRSLTSIKEDYYLNLIEILEYGIVNFIEDKEKTEEMYGENNLNFIWNGDFNVK